MKTHKTKMKVKRGLAGKVAQKVIVKKTNPFEIRLKREKFSVLGRKSQRDIGKPGISRAKAIKKREHTLLHEYKKRYKANLFVDKRIGETNSSMDLEDKMMARFAAERAKQHDKKTIYNLDEDETLTHYGQSLSEIEKYDDPRLDEDEDEAKLGATFVSMAHFGGGVEENSKDLKDGKPKSREDIIQELIADSKQKRAEKQKEKQETEELTAKLDIEWKKLMNLMAESKRKKDSDDDQEGKLEAYDISVRELKFEARGKASDKLKSPETIAREEKEKLEKLENDRLQRMKGVYEKTENVPHRSADDLEECFDLGDDADDFYVSYKDGILMGQEKFLQKSVGEKVDEEDKQEIEEDMEEEEVREEEETEEDEDSYKDMESEEDEEEEIGAGNKKQKLFQEKREKEKDEEIKRKNISADLQKRKTMIEEAKQELPYTFQAPETYEELEELFQQYNTEDIGTITERIIKCHPPGLGEGSAEKLETLYVFLLQYIQDCAVTFQCDNSETSDKKSSSLAMKTIHSLIPHLYDLSIMSPKHAADCMLGVLMEKHEEFKNTGGKQYPGLETFIFLKLAAILFPSSDFRHMVITPAVVFMLQTLSQCKVNSRRAVAAGLAMCTLIVEYTSLSQRFSSELVSFLRGVVYMSLPKNTRRVIPIVPPFRPVGREAELLVLHTCCRSYTVEPMDFLEVQTAVLIDDEFRVQAFHLSLKLLKDILTYYQTFPSATEIFSPVKELLLQIPTKNYPEIVSESIRTLLSDINDLKQSKLQVLQKEKKKPKPLKLYEPEIEENFNPYAKFRQGSREKLEHDRLLHKYKREFKGAKRELRKDNAFLARQQLKEQIERDKERKQKVKELMASLANQEAEHKKMMRENDLLKIKKKKWKK